MAGICLGAFLLVLVGAVATGHSILWALGFGVAIFSLASVRNGTPWRSLPGMLLASVSGVRPILILFALIALLTASWRMSGTVAYVICTIIGFINPACYFLWVFLLCSTLCMVVGSALGTVGMVGMVCMLTAQMAGLDTLVTAGAVMSGITMGSRLSPFSSSQALIAEMTHVPTMDVWGPLWRSSLLPLALTCAGYVGLSLVQPDVKLDLGATTRMGEAYTLSPWLLLPIGVQMALALARVPVKRAILCSSLVAYALAVIIQGVPLSALVTGTLYGYVPPFGAGQLGGGGIPSMLSPFAIVLLGAPFGRLLKICGLLDTLETQLPRLSSKFGPTRTVIGITFCIACLSCNIVLTAMVAHTVCQCLKQPPRDLSVDLSLACYSISFLLPWNMTCLAPFAVMNTSMHCLVYAFYPLALLLCGLCMPSRRRPV